MCCYGLLLVVLTSFFLCFLTRYMSSLCEDTYVFLLGFGLRRLGREAYDNNVFRTS
jgi:hypothetical protein